MHLTSTVRLPTTVLYSINLRVYCTIYTLCISALSLQPLSKVFTFAFKQPASLLTNELFPHNCFMCDVAYINMGSYCINIDVSSFCLEVCFAFFCVSPHIVDKLITNVTKCAANPLNHLIGQCDLLTEIVWNLRHLLKLFAACTSTFRTLCDIFANIFVKPQRFFNLVVTDLGGF